MRPILNSQKRIQGVTLSNVATGFVGSATIVNCIQDLGDGENPAAVVPGTVVKAVYVEMWLLGDGAQVSTTTAMVVKQPGGVDDPNSTDFTNLNTWSNKNNILEMHQGLLGDNNSNPIPVFRDWIKIPKGKQRMALGDTIKFHCKAITDGVEFCGVLIFKAYN